MSPLVAERRRKKTHQKKQTKLDALLMRRGTGDPETRQSVQHTITQIALRSLSQRVVIKINGAHKFASAERVVFNEIL